MSQQLIDIADKKRIEDFSNFLLVREIKGAFIGNPASKY
jgi:hypothetical protein